MTGYRANLLANKVAVFLAFTGVAFILFSQSTSRIFLSDDYCTINNIVHNNVLMRSFFRPVGDLTLRWNFLLAGDDPFYFYVTNIFIHAINAFLLYLFCIRWYAGTDKQVIYAFVAGLLFLTYPSHSEAILWTIGRGISLAVTFSLLAMIFYVSRIGAWVRYGLVVLSYFIALACYESVLLLPIILFALSKRETKNQNLLIASLLAGTLLLHVVLRFYFAGGIWRAYNGEIFSKGVITYFSTFVKMFLRLFIPPFNMPLLFAACGVAAIMTTGFVIFKNRRVVQSNTYLMRSMALALIGIIFSLLVAMLFGVSTRTSEGDRLLYLPSVFMCLLMSALIVSLSKSRLQLIAVCLGILLFQVAVLLQNQDNWNTASNDAVKIINKVSKTSARPLYIVNLPSDYKGAYIFRNCINEAFVHYGIDTTGIRIANVLRYDDKVAHHGTIETERNGDRLFIWPSVVVKTNGEEILVNGETAFSNINGAAILYWNGNELKSLSY